MPTASLVQSGHGERNSAVAHLEDNLAASALRLADDEFQLLGSM